MRPHSFPDAAAINKPPPMEQGEGWGQRHKGVVVERVLSFLRGGGGCLAFRGATSCVV